MAHVFPPPPISKELAERFETFSRNGRWGTCTDCPRNHTTWKTYPEFCKFTKRQDHHLTADDLAHQFNNYTRDLDRLAEREREKDAK